MQKITIQNPVNKNPEAILQDHLSKGRLQEFQGYFEQLPEDIVQSNKITALGKRFHVVCVYLAIIQKRSEILAPYNALLHKKSFGFLYDEKILSLIDLENIIKLYGLLEARKNIKILQVDKYRYSMIHYNHYFGAFLLPVLEYYGLGILSEGEVYVTSHFIPLNTEALELANILNIELVQFDVDFTEQLLNILKANDKAIKNIILPAYDFFWTHGYSPSPFTLSTARRTIFNLIENNSQQIINNKAPKITYVSRKATQDKFYKTVGTKTSGAERRDIKNEDEIIQILKNAKFNIECHFFERKTLKEKIMLMQQTDIFILQHGAALNAIYWMRKNTLIIEILPNLGTSKNPDKFGDPFPAGRVISELVGVNYTRIRQDGTHGNVNPDIVLSICQNYISN